MGSTYKRLGLLSKDTAKENAYLEASDAYKKADNLSPAKDKYYPITNWIAIDHAISLKKTGKKGKPKETIADQNDESPVDKSGDWTKLLESALAARPVRSQGKKNFWDFVAEADIRFCQLLLHYSQEEFDKMSRLYQKIWHFAGHQGNRLGTLEHLDILIDLYGFVGENKIIKMIEKCKVLLEGGSVDTNLTSGQEGITN